VIDIRHVKQTPALVILRRLLADISGLLAQPVLELLVRRRANLLAHGKYGLLLLLRELRRLLLIYDLLLDDGLAILVLLVLVHDVRPGVEILLALVAPGTLDLEALVSRGGEAARLSHSPEVVIGEAERPILESGLIIVLTLIGDLGTLAFLELRRRDHAISPSTLTLVILTVDMGTDHSRQVGWLVGAGTTEVAAWALLGSSVVLGPIYLYHWCPLGVSVLVGPRLPLHVDRLSPPFAPILSRGIPPLRVLLTGLLDLRLLLADAVPDDSNAVLYANRPVL
jgi:hypothetical protein